MAHLFNEGDQVRLKSGGPHMTVSSYQDGLVYCKWFDRVTPCSGMFEETDLEKAAVPGPDVIQSPRQGIVQRGRGLFGPHGDRK